MGDSANSLKPTFSVPPDPPPVPISATWAGGVEPIIVTFDKTVQAVPAITRAAYGGRLSDFIQTILGGSVSGSTLTIFRANDKASPGFDNISYTAAPPELVGVNTLQVVAFDVSIL